MAVILVEAAPDQRSSLVQKQSTHQQLVIKTIERIKICYYLRINRYQHNDYARTSSAIIFLL